MKYLAVSSLLLLSNEIISLLCLSIIMVMAGVDLLKAGVGGW